MRVWSTIGVLAVTAFAVSGCGGSSGGASSSAASTASASAASTTQASGVSEARPSGPVLALPKLIAAADAICVKHNIALAAATTKIETEAELNRVAKERTVVEQAALTELSKLRPAPSVEASWRRYIEYRKQSVQDLHNLVRYGIEDGETNLIGVFNGTQARMLAAAKRVGLKKCSELG